MTRHDEARAILAAFGFDAKRSNDRSARTLLALAQLDESGSWSNAANPMMGVHDVLEWCRHRLHFPVKDGTRETYRRQTLHQFIDAGFVIYNDDKPGRATNDSGNNYRLTPRLWQSSACTELRSSLRQSART